MKGLSDDISAAAQALVDAISESKELKAYSEAKELVNNNTEKLSMIRRCKELRIRLHELTENETESEEIERLQTEYEELLEDTAVYKYTKAELALGNICRKIFDAILEKIDF